MSLFQDLNASYLAAHVAKEDAFWAQKMGLGGYVEGTFEKAENELRHWTSDADTLARVRRELERADLSAEERAGLEGWKHFFEANVVEPDEAKRIAKDLVTKEGELERSRASMKLGYVDPTSGRRVDSDYLKLALVIRTNEDEATRRAAHAGMGEIEPHVLRHGFLEIVRERNRLGRMLGYADYYDYKVSRNEGFGKKKLFELLDELERGTREPAKRAIEGLQKEKGKGASEAHNFGFFTSGALTQQLDPYFGFESALGRWGRSFMALGIRYHGATLTLDLLSRAGKYENGFMHGPFPGFVDRGKYRPARINFTSLGSPGQIGAGYVMVQTLFHEGGHAAHFSNIFMPAPCFSQEFAPTSVAYAETQSMFCDSLVGDADWRVRYAKDRAGKAMPRELIDEATRRKQRFMANGVRQLLLVPYVERMIYELADAELDAETVIRRTREIERELLFLSASSRPTLSIPHLISGESSAYYHGYVLAEMAVQQTRAFFTHRDGHLLDNPRIGPDLAEHYWKPGNAKTFFALVGDLTGETLSPKALIEECAKDVPAALDEAGRAIEREKGIPKFSGAVDLDARIALVHGDEKIASNDRGESFEQIESSFAAWLSRHA
ncbi:MAG TPA: M3 family metallopeptidase [Polyangiaceae bacterium]